MDSTSVSSEFLSFFDVSVFFTINTFTSLPSPFFLIHKVFKCSSTIDIFHIRLSVIIRLVFTWLYCLFYFPYSVICWATSTQPDTILSDNHIINT
jgi:hypothetical protein